MTQNEAESSRLAAEFRWLVNGPTHLPDIFWFHLFARCEAEALVSGIKAFDHHPHKLTVLSIVCPTNEGLRHTDLSAS